MTDKNSRANTNAPIWEILSPVFDERKNKGHALKGRSPSPRDCPPGQRPDEWNGEREGPTLLPQRRGEDAIVVSQIPVEEEEERYRIQERRKNEKVGRK